MFHKRLTQDGNDSGVALVAAMGVALVGITVAMVVVAVTISTVNDSGRDRLRTIEVHAAEAAVDATMAELEKASPCGAPSFSPIELGRGAQGVVVDVQIEYFNDSSPNPIACSGGTTAETPERAVITSTAVGAVDSIGLNPERTVQATVSLEPRTSLAEDAAIFSASGIQVGAGFTLKSQDGSPISDVWLDNGNWDCSGGAKIGGSLYVPDGWVTFPNSQCHVGGDLWSQHNFTVHSTASSEFSVNGNVTVRSGNIVNNNPVNIGGDVTVGGTQVGYHPVNVDGLAQYGLGADAIQNLLPVGLPVVEYTLSDWSGFAVRDHIDLANSIKSQFTIPSWAVGELDNCNYHGWIQGLGTGPIKLAGSDTVYDLRGCASGFDSSSGMQFELYADTAIFVRDFETNNNVTFSSGDGGDHTLWVIVPHSYSSGNIINHTPMTVAPPLKSFWYAPGQVRIHNNSTIIGQVYGGDMQVHTPAEFIYTNVGVPGVELSQQVQSLNGFHVGLLGKREVS